MSALRVIDGGGDGGPVVQSKPRDYTKRYCAHAQMELDTERRRTYCRACEAEVDNFDALVKLAQEWETQQYRTAEATRQADDLEARVSELRREERNTKARLRRAKPAGEAAPDA